MERDLHVDVDVYTSIQDYGYCDLHEPWTQEKEGREEEEERVEGRREGRGKLFLRGSQFSKGAQQTQYMYMSRTVFFTTRVQQQTET